MKCQRNETVSRTDKGSDKHSLLYPFLLAPNEPTNGFLFRTDGNQSVANQWQLFTVATNLTTTEKFKLYVPANDSCVIVKATTSDLILADNKTPPATASLTKCNSW